ncbi:11672_t:CDS:2 [Acaulospora morrowiae]|uniref:11672_t:CDS:1 n=1 Tax=Acaulospora morrowiae TaxID=94023 RepID=A0A9N9GUF8_9GLOM|nr:11672_t:CDS:2 [Acaulospora morrowiae]
MDELTEETLKIKAAEIVSHLYPDKTILTFSTGWFQKFKKYHSIWQFVVHGESGLADTAAINNALPDLHCLISIYAPENMFNVDETEGKKVDKQCLTVVACVNTSGSEKLLFWIISKYAWPHYFKRVNICLLGCEYRANIKAWMNVTLFNEWLHWFSIRMAGRQVLLLMNNCSAHTADILDIANTEIKFLPPNITLKLQPLDSRIIRILKAHYHCHQALQMLELFSTGLQTEQSKLDILNMINIIMSAWELNMTANTIANFAKCTRKNQVYRYDSRQKLVNYDNEQEICEVQMKKEFFASLGSRNLVANEEESGDSTVEHPYYTFKQVHKALRFCKAMQFKRARLPDMFTRQFTD